MIDLLDLSFECHSLREQAVLVMLVKLLVHAAPQYVRNCQQSTCNEKSSQLSVSVIILVYLILC